MTSLISIVLYIPVIIALVLLVILVHDSGRFSKGGH